MKQKLLILVMLFASSYGFSQISISAARALGVGATVTVKGIVTNGDELGPIRYIQDATGGVAAYSSTLSTVLRGDSILITGVLKNYNQLLEIDPVTSFTVINSGNTLPTPELIVPDSLIESRESTLIQIDNVNFTTNPGGTFSSNTSYNIISGGQTSSIFVRSGHPLIGTIIPSGLATIIGIESQYDYTNPTAGYQILCRDTNDIVLSNNIAMTSPVTESNISQTGITLSWTTSLAGTTELMYGNTPNLGLVAAGTGTSATHSIGLTGLSASELLYVRAFSVDGIDTAFALVKTFITQSASSGNVIAYFNTPVDNSVSSGTNAIYLHESIDDTLIAYIDRAQSTIDFTMYNFNETGISSISTALNNAHARGVTVRMIFDGSAGNTGIQNVDAAIKKIGSPTSSSYGIMHNKFIVIDAYDADPNVPLVWTGGTNLTDGQVNLDPNTVIIIQDKSLAIAYTLEFNEMFGSTSPIPSLTEAKFGPFKTDNTPHNFIIGGKNVSSYFSPTDGTNDKIIQTIGEADDNIRIATMLITRSDIAYALDDAVTINSVDLKVLVNHQSDCSSTVWSILSGLIGTDLRDDRDLPGIMHHKLMIVDEGTSSSPTLLVGSHNWSNAANNINDENTLIFYDNQELANIYYQAFKYRFDETQIGIAEVGFANSVACFPNPSQGQFTVELDAAQSMDLNISIYDLSGRVVMQETQMAHAGSNQININASSLAKGTYVLQIISNGKQFVNTLVIQ